ncbi:MAG: hypothetical protein LBJ67_14635 [Planctomycetaceae bacterium]|jgi:outer membrane protein TolC|nr:hypothetical protein [Planctomycetaceae bacterium]
MKKTLVLFACVLLICSVFVQFQVVAEQINPDPECIALLEKRVELKKQKFKAFGAYVEAGTIPVAQYVDAQIEVTEAKIDLYRYADNQKELITTLEKRVELKKQKFTAFKAYMEAGIIPEAQYIDAQIETANAEIDLYRYMGKQKELITTLEEKLNLSKKNYKSVEGYFDSGKITPEQLADTQVTVIDAELELKLEKNLQASEKLSKTNNEN